MSTEKKTLFKRIHFLNPISNQTQMLKIKKNIIEESTKFPVPISTQVGNKVLTIYIDENFKVRATDISYFIPDLVPYPKEQVSLSPPNAQTLFQETQFKIFKNQLLQDSGVSGDSGESQKSQGHASDGKILMVGLSKVGKSSIVKRLAHDLYDPNIKPTLGSNIIKIFLEEMNFQIFDMGGQEKLRSQWFRQFPHFSAIIFVVNLTQSEKMWEETKKEFQHVHKYYFQDLGISAQTPLLILGNKLDLLSEPRGNHNTEIQQLVSHLELNVLPVNYHVGLTSALNNEGIIPNFKWLVRNYILMRKEL